MAAGEPKEQDVDAEERKLQEGEGADPVGRGVDLPCTNA
jgi:hypothetical protein